MRARLLVRPAALSREARPNVLPFVDVMLVLLIVFMVAAPLLVQGVALNLPRAQSASVAPSGEVATLSLTAEGVVFWNDDRLNDAAFAARLAALARDLSPSAAAAYRIHVRGDAALPYGEMARRLAQLRGAGFTRLALLTRAPAIQP